MTAKTASRGGQVSRVSEVIQVVLWIAILTIAFFMQVIPFLLVLTMLNLAIGISSGVALVLVPAAAFAMLSFACWIATRRTRNMLPEPLPHPTYVARYSSVGPKSEPLTPQQRVISFLQRWRQHRF